MGGRRLPDRPRSVKVVRPANSPCPFLRAILPTRAEPAILPTMPESPLRLHAARAMLRLAPLLLVAAHLLEWTPRFQIWELWTEFLPRLHFGIRFSMRGWSYWNLTVALPVLTFFCITAPWPWCERVLMANAPLRWICRAFALTTFLGIIWIIASVAGMIRPLDHIRSGGWSLVLAAYVQVLGLCLLPGRKPTAPFIPPGHESP